MIPDAVGNNVFLEVPSVCDKQDNQSDKHSHPVFCEVSNVVALQKFSGIRMVIVLKLHLLLQVESAYIQQRKVEHREQEGIVVCDKTKNQHQ